MARYIDADELYDILSLFYDTEIVRKDKVARFIAEQTLFDIKEIPTADVQEVVHGEWKEVYDINSQDYNSDNNWWLRCSCCQNHTKINFRKQRFDYCPNCGAKIDGGNDEPTT